MLQKKKFLLIFITCIVSFAQAHNLSWYLEADEGLKSGEITWTMKYELFFPEDLKEKDRMQGMSTEQFEAWKQSRLKEYKVQDFYFTCLFEGDNHLFMYHTEAGDIFPVAMERTMAFDGSLLTMINHRLEHGFRSPVKTSFLESNFSHFCFSPRLFGYGVEQISALAAKMTNSKGAFPEVVNQVNPKDSSTIQIMGQYPDGESVLLAEIGASETADGIFSKLKYYNPKHKTRVMIEASELSTYNAGIVYPKQTVITRYPMHGSLENLEEEPLLERLTITVDTATFNLDIPDSMFTPSIPDGYKYLNEQYISMSQ